MNCLGLAARLSELLSASLRTITVHVLAIVPRQKPFQCKKKEQRGKGLEELLATALPWSLLACPESHPWVLIRVTGFRPRLVRRKSSRMSKTCDNIVRERAIGCCNPL